MYLEIELIIHIILVRALFKRDCHDGSKMPEIFWVRAQERTRRNNTRNILELLLTVLLRVRDTFACYMGKLVGPFVKLYRPEKKWTRKNCIKQNRSLDYAERLILRFPTSSKLPAQRIEREQKVATEKLQHRSEVDTTLTHPSGLIVNGLNISDLKINLLIWRRGTKQRTAAIKFHAWTFISQTLSDRYHYVVKRYGTRN